MTSKVLESHKSSSNFSANPTLPLMLPSSNCVDLSLYLPLLPMQTLIYTQRNVFHKMKYDLKGQMRPLLCGVIFKNSQIFWSNYNLDLRSYRQLLSLFRLQSRADDLEALMNDEVTDINELLSVINNIQVWLIISYFSVIYILAKESWPFYYWLILFWIWPIFPFT